MSVETTNDSKSNNNLNDANLQTNCIFCNIVNKKYLSTNNNENAIEFENDNIIIIKDIKPAAKNHYLAITKRHITDGRCLTKDDKDLVEEMQKELKSYMQNIGSDLNDVVFGFHWPPFISVKHLHMHGISPVSSMSFIGNWIFKPYNMWFKTPEYVLSNL